MTQIDPRTVAQAWLDTPAGEVLSRKAGEYQIQVDVANREAIAAGKNPNRVPRCRERAAANAAISNAERAAVKAWFIATYGRDALDWDTVSDVIFEARKMVRERA